MAFPSLLFHALAQVGHRTLPLFSEFRLVDGGERRCLVAYPHT
ncbi:hypothetical protein SNOG_09040 [Parastagonospora nodorum SN15]|uniref:Uncharacterized protein n=1 Tax=Phaeosphaeria nodorum (strain SN15 / ATCC MYA-4574 / FGSC 10173) TaxID=321614 RepID=Q0UGS4_PHANO|nr:hypothetical protein SNOG_09040 [Parastagonospora nodorum SN15]EAT83232.1 hypothetical protein SNOG_09040 [Parastagonospora nodorum SN15]